MKQNRGQTSSRHTSISYVNEDRVRVKDYMAGADPGGGARGPWPPLPPKKTPHKYEFVWLNSLRQHNSQARTQGGQGGLGPPPYKILDPPMYGI